jgi:DNA polymerase-3 subunit gamma/tau
MRDALSLLDQIMTCSDGPVTHEQVLDILGVVDRHIITDLADALLSGDVPRLLPIIETVYNRGQDLKKLYADLLSHMRNLMVIKMGAAGAKLVDLPVSEIQHLGDKVRSLSVAALNQVFSLLYRDEALVRLAAQPRLAMEMVLMQICQSKPALPMDELIAGVESLRQAVIDGGGVAEATESFGSAPEPTGHAAPRPAAQDVSGADPLTRDDTLMVIPEGDMARRTAWDRIVDCLAANMPALAASLKEAVLIAADETAFTIEVKGNDFSINRVKRGESIAAIRRTIAQLFGRSVKVLIQGESRDPTVKLKKKNREEQLKQQALSHPLVGEAIELFQGKVVDVKILSSDAKE